MDFRKIVNLAGDITAGALISAFGTNIYLPKEKYFPKDKKKRKKIKKYIEKNGLEVEVSPMATLLTLSTLFILYKDLKNGDKYAIFSSALFTTILMNLFVLRKK